MIQETLLSDSKHLKLKREQVYFAFFKNGRKRGIAILFNKSVYFNHEKTINDKKVRYVIVIGTIPRNKIKMLNLYTPNEACIFFFKRKQQTKLTKLKELVSQVATLTVS